MSTLRRTVIYPGGVSLTLAQRVLRPTSQNGFLGIVNLSDRRSIFGQEQLKRTALIIADGPA